MVNRKVRKCFQFYYYIFCLTDAKERLWSFDIKDYEVLVSKFDGLKGNFELSGLPNFVLRCVRSPKTDLSEIDLSPIEPELRNSLMPFQRHGVA